MAGDHSVGGYGQLVHPEVDGAVFHKGIDFPEAACIEESLDPLSGCKLSPLVLFFDLLDSTQSADLLQPPPAQEDDEREDEGWNRRQGDGGELVAILDTADLLRESLLDLGEIHASVVAHADPGQRHRIIFNVNTYQAEIGGPATDITHK